MDLPDIHVIPINDMKEHIHSRKCWCNPRLEQKNTKETLVIHNSMDGRELIERHGIN